jgi:hypothetical protein
MDQQRETIDDPRALAIEIPTFPAAVEWGLDQFDAHEDSAPRVSVWLGLAGLGSLLSLFACIPPIAIELLNSSLGLPPPPGYLLQAIIIQSIFLPPVISSTIVIAAVFFWYVPISIRYLVAATLAIPAGILFLGLMSYFEQPMPADFVKSFFAAMFALFVSAGATAMVVQMWSPWALTHFRFDDRQLPKLGTRALFELTTVTAISYAIIIALSNDPALTTSSFIVGISLFSAFGILASLTGIGLLLVFLRDRQIRLASAWIPLMLMFVAALMLPAFIAVQEFGWNSIRSDAPIVIVAAVYGLMIIGAVITLHLGWLSTCGWRCVNRRDDV